jgi:hypothetical protein
MPSLASLDIFRNDAHGNPVWIDAVQDPGISNGGKEPQLNCCASLTTLMDLVTCCRGRAEEALARMRDIMTKLKLTVNETKTRSANCRKRNSTF